MSHSDWEKLALEVLDRHTIEGVASRAVSDGDRECSNTMIELARGELSQGGDISEVVREYLATCFDRMAEGEEPDKVFGRKAPRRGPRPNVKKLQRDAELAFFMRHFLAHGMSIKDAAKHVEQECQHYPDSIAREVGTIGADAIEAAYYRFYPTSG